MNFRVADRSDRVARQLSIASMNQRDLREVVKLELATYPQPWSKKVFEDELTQVAAGTRSYVVARIRRELVGYAGLWFVADPDGDQAHVTNIVVAAQQRRNGIGRTLMLALARSAIERGCVSWTLEVRSSATAAQEMYRKFGFVPAGIRKQYYENNEDGIVMWCHDIQLPEYAVRLGELA